MLKFVKSSLVVFLGFVFVFSAVAKMVPLEFFEFQIADIVKLPWRYIQLISRFIIGFEFALGIMIIAHVELRRITLPLVLGLLTFFTALLVYQYFVHGNQPNCGCFGDQVHMSTMAGIGKNIVLILVALIIRYLAPDWEWKLGKYRWAYPLVFVLLMIIPWQMMKPISWAKVTDRKPRNEELNYDVLYDPEEVDHVPSFDYKKGKHIIIFADYGCNHCKLAAQKSSIMKAQNPSLPLLIVMSGDSARVDSFRRETQSENLEYVWYKNIFGFTPLAGGEGFPSINWVHDGLLEYRTLHFELLQEDVEEWLKK